MRYQDMLKVAGADSNGLYFCLVVNEGVLAAVLVDQCQQFAYRSRNLQLHISRRSLVLRRLFVTLSAISTGDPHDESRRNRKKDVLYR